MPEPDESGRWYLLRRWYAIAAFVPVLLAAPGRLSADTKTYLTVDPGRLLADASSMWDPSVGAGTVPHQNIGYLFPLGPYYWLLDTLAVPGWIAQRLVWGILVFAASWGACRLGRLLGWSTTMAGVAGLAYGFTPYLLSYLARLSVILFPWAAMPWMIVLAMRLVRRPRWSTAAAFAGLVALVGSVNATALVFAGLGPTVVVLADLVTRRVRWRPALGGIGAVGLLTAGVSAWWIVGLSVQGGFGLPILRFTETYRAVAGASTPAEIVRGLGYWFFYGGDRLDRWVGPSSSYTNEGWLILLGFGIAMLSLLGLLVRFPRRGTFVALLAVGAAVSVGGAPVSSPSLYGEWFSEFATDSTAGAALRSTTRAMPLVVLALGAGFGALADAARRRLAERRDAHGRPRLDPRVPAVVASGLLVAQFFPWFIGTMTTESLLRDDAVPAHVQTLADDLDSFGDGRVLMVPGSDFAYPRVGGTIDPILPGVLDRPVLYRELVPQGSQATADLLNAVERRLHDGWSEAEAWPTTTRLLAASAVAAINDHQYERFRLARPGQLWPDLEAVYGPPDSAGTIVADVTEIDLVDGITYADPDVVDEFPIVAAWDLTAEGDGATSGPVSVRPTAGTILLDGSGDGIVDLAGTGLLTPDDLTRHTVRYRASLDAEAASDGAAVDTVSATTADAAWWVVTDTNRAQGRRWSTIGSNLGPIEPAATRIDLDADPGDQRLDVFGDDQDTDPVRRTVAEHRGDVALVRSSYTGSRIAYTPEDAPFMATDGDPATAWRTAVFDDARGLELRIDVHEPADLDHLVVVQPVNGVVDRFITRVRITLTEPGGTERSIDADLGDASRTLDGQRVDLPPGAAVDRVSIEILADNLGQLASYAGRPGVGFAEVRLPGVDDDRVVRMPIVGTDTDITPGDGDRLTYVMTRERIDAATQNRFAPERRLVRVFDVAGTRTAELTAEVRLGAQADDRTLAAALGLDAALTANRRVIGTTTTSGLATADGDRSTAWTTPIDGSVGATLTIPTTGVSLSGIRLHVRDDEQHSVPTRLVVGDGTDTAVVDIPADASLDPLVVPWPAALSAAADAVTITIDDLRARTADEYFSGLPQVLPVAVEEVDLVTSDGGSAVAVTVDPDRSLATLGCRDDLITLDGAPVPVTLDGTVGTLLRGGSAVATTCDGGAIELTAGERRLETVPGVGTGIDVDRVVLDAPGERSDPASDQVIVSTERASSTALRSEIGPSDATSWLTLHESWNEGWTASIDGRDLGEPVLVDGYANGWLLPPSDESRTVEFRWTPQDPVRIGIAVSLLSGVAIVALLALAAWRRREPIPIDDRDHPPASGPPQAAVQWAGWIGLALAGVLVAGPVPTAVAVTATVLGIRLRRWWIAPTVVTVTIGITGGWIAAAETVRDYADSPDWPSAFSWTTPLVWTAIATVVATAATRRGSRSALGVRLEVERRDGPGDHVVAEVE